MLKSFDELQDEARRNFAEFAFLAALVCERLKRKFEVKENDSEEITFSIDGFCFVLSWEEKIGKALGSEINNIEFVLSSWRTVYFSNRDIPPEEVDDELLRSNSWIACFRRALEVITENEISGVIDGALGEMEEKPTEEM